MTTKVSDNGSSMDSHTKAGVMSVVSGHCYRCKRGALLYWVWSKVKEAKVGVCYECREFIQHKIKELEKKVD